MPGTFYASVPGSRVSLEMRMALQSAIAALVIVLLSSVIHLQQSAWAITASTYVIVGSASGTADRVRRRIVGTLIGVPLGILCLPICLHFPPLAWVLAAVAMIIYAIALPDRYDVACAAYAFTLMVTLAVSGETSDIRSGSTSLGNSNRRIAWCGSCEVHPTVSQCQSVNSETMAPPTKPISPAMKARNIYCQHKPPMWGSLKF